MAKGKLNRTEHVSLVRKMMYSMTAVKNYLVMTVVQNDG